MSPSRYINTRFFNKALIRNNGIARRIMVALILFSSVITAIITGVELYFDYRVDIRHIDERIESIRKIYLPTLIESVWVAERTQIQNQLDGLLNLGDIEYISVVADGKVAWSAGAPKSTRQIEKIIPLNRIHRGQSLSIGGLHVVASVDNVLSRLWSKLIVMLVSNAIKTFLVTTFVLLIFQAMVGQHLEHISGYLRQLEKDMSNKTPLRLNRAPTGRWRPDALDHVTAATNQMRVEITRFSSELMRSKKDLESIIQAAPVAIYTSDAHHIVTSWNPAAEKMFGWSAAEVIGHGVLFVPADRQDEFLGIHAKMLAGEAIHQKELLWQRRDGTPIHINLSIVPMKTGSDEVSGSLAIASDITKRKKAEQRIEYLAFHDVLTGLPNRLLLQDRFEQVRANLSRSDAKLALLFLDLDNFKSINDTLGHDTGDELLKQIATRLSDCVRESDTISRQGGDEFLILVSNLNHADDAASVLVKIIGQLQLPFQIGGHEISTSVSIGATLFPQDATDFEELLKKADMAMYRAKSDGRNTYRFFDEAMNTEATEYLLMRNGLRRALERDEFVLHYQPQINLSSGAVIGAEALLRWKHPEMGMVDPSRFIPVAEESGLIIPMGEWVVREACRQAMVWQRAGLPAMTVAVNLSAVQFRRGDVERSVVQALEHTGFDPALLELELTESILIQNVEHVLATVQRLKLLGVKISIDDFGTGYSSLSYLKRFDIDKLKIDQSFVRDLASDPDDAAIVQAIIQMARSLNLSTIAEGVETAEIQQLLKAFQCDEAQGYHFARPMPGDEFTRHIQSRASTAA